MGKPPLELVLKQVCPKVSCLGPKVTLMFYLKIYQQLLSSLQMIRLFFPKYIQNINTSASHLNSNSRKTSNWAFQWEMSFDQDPSKPAEEVTFYQKIQKTCDPSIYFHNKSLLKRIWPMIIDNKLNFLEHFKNKLNKVNRIIGLLRKMQNILPPRPLLTI